MQVCQWICFYNPLVPIQDLVFCQSSEVVTILVRFGGFTQGLNRCVLFWAQNSHLLTVTISNGGVSFHLYHIWVRVSARTAVVFAAWTAKRALVKHLHLVADFVLVMLL